VSVTGEGEYVHQHGDPIWLNFGAYGVDLSVDPDTGALTIHDIVFVAMSHDHQSDRASRTDRRRFVMGWAAR